MKKIAAFLAIGAILVSCSNDDDNQKEKFFNLAEGNFWVYKQYFGRSFDDPGTFTGMTDTVRVVGQRYVNGKKYYEMTHSYKAYNEFIDTFLRVNEKGHLVNPNDLVIHPGIDKNYQFTEVFNGSGYVDYQLSNVKDVTIDDQNYLVYPYIGNLTNGKGVVSDKFRSYDYQKGLGFVMKHRKENDIYMEERLVYYQVK